MTRGSMLFGALSRRLLRLWVLSRRRIRSLSRHRIRVLRRHPVGRAQLASRLQPAWAAIRRTAQDLPIVRIAAVAALLAVVTTLTFGTAPRPGRHAVDTTRRLAGQHQSGRVAGQPLPGQAAGGGLPGSGRSAGFPLPSRNAPTDPGRSAPGGPTVPGAPAGAPTPPDPTVPATPDAVRHLGTRQVALTFDDGPDGATPQILALLRQYHVKATFCIIGVNVHGREDMLRQIVADGHSLCNHTWRHDLKLGTRSPDAIRSDMQRTNDEIHRAVPGAPIRYFRHPGGNFTPAAIAVARELGMTSIMWNVDPSDWNVRRYGSESAMTNHIVNAVTSTTHPGAIILSHDGGGQRGATVAAYRTLLPWLTARYELVALPV